MRGRIGWALFVALTWLVAQLLYLAARLPYRIAGLGEIERRLGDRAWLERYAETNVRAPIDYERRTW